jgi:protein involved in polysaccharide export with SLBB domain
MRWLFALCCTAMLILAGCGEKPTQPQEPTFAVNDAVTAAPSVENADYVIAMGDFLAVQSASHPELDCVARVDAAGEVPLKVIGYLRAAGSTTGEFAVTAGIRYMEKPGYETGVEDLSVHVKRGLYLVTGQVANGGFRAYKDGLTIYDAVVSAGKMKDDAIRDYVVLHRKGAEGREIVRYRTLEDLKAKPLMESDWVVIPYRVDFILH